MISTAIDAPLLQVLLVEDSLTQAMLMKNVVENSEQLQLIGVARDGEEALEFLAIISITGTGTRTASMGF